MVAARHSEGNVATCDGGSSRPCSWSMRSTGTILERLRTSAGGACYPARASRTAERPQGPPLSGARPLLTSAADGSRPRPRPALRRTPLFDSPRDAGARLVAFAGWEMPVQYEGVRDEHIAVRGAAASSTSRTWARSRPAARRRSRCCSASSPTTSRSVAVGGAQYSVLCREDGGVLDDLFTYRLEPDRYLTVTNAANHASDLAWFQRARRGLRREVTDRARRLRDARGAGPARARDLQAVADAPLPARMCTGERRLAGAECSSAAPATPARTASSCCVAPDDAPRVWDELVRRGARPAGLGARDTLRLEVCFHLYGNDLARSAGRSRRGSAGAARRTPASSAPMPCAPCARPGPRSGSSPSRSTGPASRARATRSPAAAW